MPNITDLSEFPVAADIKEANHMLAMLWRERNDMYFGREIFKYIAIAQLVIIILLLIF